MGGGEERERESRAERKSVGRQHRVTHLHVLVSTALSPAADLQRIQCGARASEQHSLRVQLLLNSALFHWFSHHNMTLLPPV